MQLLADEIDLRRYSQVYALACYGQLCNLVHQYRAVGCCECLCGIAFRLLGTDTLPIHALVSVSAFGRCN